jgi:hypothetical protein
MTRNRSTRGPMPTIRRLCFIGVLTGALLVALPGFGRAKGPGLDHAVLKGPGIEGPLRLTDHHPYMLNRSVLSLAFGSSRDRDISRDAPPSDDALGPRYRIAYHMAAGRPILVDLYPYAAGGPLAFAPAGQALAVGIGHSDKEQRFEVNPGWYDFPPRLVSQLRDQGLPSEAAARDGSWRVPGWFLVLAALALGGPLVQRGIRRLDPKASETGPSAGARA